MHRHWGFLGGSGVKNLPANEGDEGLIPSSRRFPGEGNGHPSQYSCLGNPMDRGDWQATVHGSTKGSDMTKQLNNKNNNKAHILSNVILLKYVGKKI